MADEITGQYQYQPSCAGTAPCTHLTAPEMGTTFIFINQPEQYPGTLGLIDGPTAPTGDQSVNMGQAAIHDQINQQINNGNTPVTVVGYSEGAVAASHEVSVWQPTDPVAFVLIGDPERPDGGILARMPAGTYIPVLGITGGNATPSNGAPVVMVTQQYDGIADAPVYVLNLAADANALLGAYYLHGNGNYFDVDPNAPGNIVTTSPDGNMTDILVPAAPGALPLFIPLAQAGVPQPILVALDPAVRAIIETGYDRTSDPSQQVRFALLPPASAWAADAQAVSAGFALTAQELPAALAISLPSLPGLPVLPSTLTPAPAPSATGPTPVTQLQSSSPVQHTLINATNNTGSSVVQPETGIPTTSALEPTTSQTVSTPNNTVPTVDRTPKKMNSPRSTATTDSTLSDRTSTSEAVSGDTNPARSPGDNAAEVRTNSTKTSHPQPGKGVADHHTETS